MADKEQELIRRIEKFATSEASRDFDEGTVAWPNVTHAHVLGLWTRLESILSPQGFRAIESLGFRFVGELAQKSLEEVKALEGMKPEILVEIQRQLNYCGFQLGTVLSPDIKAIYDRELSKDRGLSERKKR